MSPRINSARPLPASRARKPAEGIALCIFGLTCALCVIFATGSAPFVQAWALEVIAW
ncbi:hypothetical protein ACHZ97_14715 [Lysobacter soli]|uniref:hypothetical protein n=1 Tax=Lysobacter soli TaxID=453783 RepID=UPI0037CA447A